MADNGDRQDREPFDSYQKVAAEYRSCLIRCQQAVDQLRACEEELKLIAASRGISGAEVEADFGIIGIEAETRSTVVA